MQLGVPSILLSIVLALAVNVRADSNLSEKPVIMISPESVDMAISSADAENQAPQLLELTVLNRTKSDRKFNKFYDCWSPILVSESGVVLHLGLSRDATRLPSASDFPNLAPGKSAITKVPFKLVHADKKIRIVFYDSTGGDFSAPINPGNYKLCIFYRPRTDDSLIRLETERLGLKLDQLWVGCAMSNWIDICIKP